ncbi:hypothetical protein ACLO87_12430 [Paenalcaligenes sp. Me52]|uniref:hypothetical protein n=1 Tax=Paenalcaligenes sp. Me52 TaxID=3392038 RepID=UPI003D2A7A6C
MDILFLGSDLEAFSASSCHTRHLDGLLRPANLHRVKQCSSSELHTLEEHSIDVIILDATIPTMEKNHTNEDMLGAVLRVARRGYIFNMPVPASQARLSKAA